MPVAYSGQGCTKREAASGCSEALLRGEGAGMTLFLHAQERPQNTTGTQVPQGPRYSPAGETFSQRSAGRPKRRAGRGQRLPRSSSGGPGAPRSSARGARGSLPQRWSCGSGPVPVPRRGSQRPRFSASTRPRRAEPALPGWRAKQSGDRERKTGRKYGSCRLPALRLDLPA